MFSNQFDRLVNKLVIPTTSKVFGYDAFWISSLIENPDPEADTLRARVFFKDPAVHLDFGTQSAGYEPFDFEPSKPWMEWSVKDFPGLYNAILNKLEEYVTISFKTTLPDGTTLEESIEYQTLAVRKIHDGRCYAAILEPLSRNDEGVDNSALGVSGGFSIEDGSGNEIDINELL